MKDRLIDLAILAGFLAVLATLIAMLTGVSISDQKWRQFKREHQCFTLDETRAKCADGKIYWRPE